GSSRRVFARPERRDRRAVRCRRGRAQQATPGGVRQPANVRRCPPPARGSNDRCNFDRDAEPLARADRHLGMPGGQGRLRREAVPAGVDYDLWTGPAPLKPFTRNRFHYNWHWIWETGNGDLGNQGVHQIDVARWGLGVRFPSRVSAVGGHFMFDDDQETPNTLNCAFEFDQPGGHRKIMEFEVRHWITNNEGGLGHGLTDRNAIGNIFYGSKI